MFSSVCVLNFVCNSLSCYSLDPKTSADRSLQSPHNHRACSPAVVCSADQYSWCGNVITICCIIHMYEIFNNIKIIVFWLWYCNALRMRKCLRYVIIFYSTDHWTCVSRVTIRRPFDACLPVNSVAEWLALLDALPFDRQARGLRLLPLGRRKWWSYV